MLLGALLWSCSTPESVNSPDGKIQVLFNINDGIPYYSVKRNDELLIDNSKLGFKLKNANDLSNNFEISKIERDCVNETWTQPWGEVKNISNHYNSLVITLREKSDDQRIIKLNFRAYNDGVGFRYEIPEQPNLDSIIIDDELTEFNFIKNFKSWWIPAYGDDVDSEHLFKSNSLNDLKETVHTPLTMEYGDDLFLSIHEAALVNYSAMTLTSQGTKLKCELVPWSTGEKVRTSAPMVTPWRTIQIAESAGDLITSYLILNLNEPSKIENLSWVNPGKYNGIWWGMHLGHQTWNLGPNHGATTENVKELIDFAAENNMKGVLVEGWNQGWEDWNFNFTTPYEDFDIKWLTEYARSKGVSIIGHHETGGNIDNYEAQLTDAFEYYHNLGIHAVKTGYVTKKPNGKEWHQGQYMVNHQNKVLELAAKYQIMLDVHEPVKGTGLRRTYPNMMTQEGARGTEYDAWSEGNPPEHTVILPFTRCLAGPMDYTPGIFDILIEEKPENRVHSTLAKQLSLYVTIYSPLQMVTDLPENYKNHPAFQFIRDVPTDWEKSIVLNGQIGDYVTIVRKDRNSDDWYLGSSTDENSRSFDVDLNFLLPDKKYLAQIYADAEDTNLETNPTSYIIKQDTVTSNNSLPIRLAGGGGQAIRFHLLD
nr:glycoside hydrolase family 97 protein [Marinigracilibium pacificum]